MNLKAEILLVLIFLSILYFNKYVWKKERNYNNILIIVMFMCTAINVKIADFKPFFDEGKGIYIPLVVFVVATVAIVTIRFNYVKLSSIKITLDEIILIIILASIFLSYISGQIKDMSKFYSIVALYLSILFIGIMYKNLRVYNVEHVLNAFSYMAIYNGVLSMLQYITNKKLLIGVFNDDILYRGGYDVVKRVVGIAGSNNSAGNLGSLLFSITLFNYLRTKKKIHLFAVIVNGVFLALTLTRVGYLASGIGAVIFFFFSEWDSDSKVKKLRVVFWSILSMLTVALIYGQKIYNVLFTQRGNTTNSRQNQYQNVFDRIISHNGFWNGIGVGQYKYYTFLKFKVQDLDIHSQYINVLAEQGLFIFILFIILNMYILKKAFDNTEYMLERAFLLSLFLGNLICCNFNPNQYYTINNLVYYLLMYSYVHKKYNSYTPISYMIKIKLLNIKSYIKPVLKK